MAKQITPEKELQILEQEITPFIEKIKEGFTITSQKELKQASEIRVQLKAYEKQVKEKRETASKPAYAAYKAIMNMFSPIESATKEKLSLINAAMSSYQEEQEAIAEKERQKIENRIGEGKGHLKVETAIEKMDQITTPDKVVESASGSTMFVDKPDCEVEDISLVPKEYLIADIAKIKEDMKKGIRIDGVRYFTRKVPRNA